MQRSTDGHYDERGKDGRQKYSSDHNERADEEDGPNQRREHGHHPADDARPGHRPSPVHEWERVPGPGGRTLALGAIASAARPRSVVATGH